MEISTIEMRDVTAGRAPPYREEQPPSYDSFYGKIKHARDTSDGKVGFLKDAMKIAGASVAFIVCMSFSLAIPIACIVIGVFYYDDCPLESFIPVYLVVSGSAAILPMVLVICISCINIFVPDQDENDSCCLKCYAASATCVIMLFSCFLSGWYIAGNVWVYSNYDDLSTNSTSENYCHPTAYYFSFWLFTSTYILTGFSCVVSCICCCVGGVASLCE
ncbi:transmembrane protein 272-like [Crassostrea virginica]|uniref:Uncharacterized protein LOC111137037 n=1 Tax=Crassostrea virginica TaxID=6565 RepID=A0A8B8EVM1_CRAVI|nr:uncharacterized protein LOC111137037 [Crassostrea virginica]